MSPKAKVTYDQHKFEVEFNVSEYLPEELSIKTEGDVLIVLAKHETKAEGGPSYVSKQFEQRFSLPSGVKPEKISSKLSKEGTLTVTAPRESLAISAYKKKGLENSSSGGTVYNQSEETKQSEGLPHPSVTYDDDKFEISLDAKDYKPEDLDVKVEGNSIVITAKQELPEAGGVRTRVFEQKFSLPSGVKAELVRSSLTREGLLVITAPRGNTAAQRTYTETLENKMDRVMEPSSWDKDRDSVKRDDSFFDDSVRDVKKKESFFDDSRRDFEERRKEFFDDFHKDSIFNDKRRESAFDDLRKDSFNTNALANTRHGSIFDKDRSALFDSRERSGSLFDEQNGLSRVVYEDDLYKILINVEKFLPEELMIKTVDNNVIVEAKHEEKTSDGRSFSTQSFNQSFALPRGVNPEAVSSSLSKAGVLTISAPLPKALKPSGGERLVPIKHS